MPSKHIKTILNILVYIIGIILIFILVPKLIKFFMPFVIGWIIAMLANPLIKFFEKNFKLVRKHGSWLVIVGTLSLVVAICYFLIAWLVREGIALVESIPQAYAIFVEEIHMIGSNLSVLLTKLPGDLNNLIVEFFINIDTYIGDLVSKIGMPTLSVAGNIAKNIPNLLVMTIFMLLSAYFFIADKEKIETGTRNIIPKSFFDRWDWLKDVFSKAVGGYFKAQFKIMGIIAIILWVGFMILRINYALLLGVVISFLDFLPFLGTGTAIWPWSIFLVLTGDYTTAIGLIIIYFICLLVHQLLQPKFVGDTVGLDSLTTLIFMFIGYRFSSVFGMIIAVPIGIIIVNLYKAGAFDKIILDVKSLIQYFNQYRHS
ncbi:MAG: sporulation integral membrane protein YtvI [Bacilli bacterium]|nr:sporulation integral membrane protein YtvI [Bacilli bacterium]